MTLIMGFLSLVSCLLRFAIGIVLALDLRIRVFVVTSIGMWSMWATRLSLYALDLIVLCGFTQ